jgi:hypothetical protein
MWHLLIITQHWVRKDTRKYQTSSATMKVKLTEMLFSANLPRKTSTNSTASSTSDVSCRSNPDVPSYSSNTNMSSQIRLGRVEKTERLIIYLNKLNWFTEMYLTTMSNTQMLSYWDISHLWTEMLFSKLTS